MHTGAIQTPGHSLAHGWKRLQEHATLQVVNHYHTAKLASSVTFAHRQCHRQQQYVTGCGWQHACWTSRLYRTRCHTCQASINDSSGSRDDLNDQFSGSASSSSSRETEAALAGGENLSKQHEGEEEEQQKHSEPQLQEQASSSIDSSISEPKWQQLQLAMRKLHALEEYQQLMQQHDYSADSSSSSSPKSNLTSSKSVKETSTARGEAPGAASPADTFSLLDATLLIARHAHPDLDPSAVKQQLDQLAAEVDAGLPEGSRYPLRIIKEINRVLYQVHGFQGNMEDYYHPDNSCINRVLETKKGIPISLSVVYMEVAARVGLPMGGVNLPAHFMIKPLVEDMEWLVDAFNGGELTALQDAEEVLGKLTGYQVKLDPRFVSGETPPVSSRALLLRLLNNLRQTYITLNMAEEALNIIRYMQATAPPGALPELSRDEGLCLYGLGRLSEASTVLSTYLASQPDAQESAVVVALLQRIKQKTSAAQQVQDGSQEQKEERGT